MLDGILITQNIATLFTGKDIIIKEAITVGILPHFLTAKPVNILSAKCRY